MVRAGTDATTRRPDRRTRAPLEEGEKAPAGNDASEQVDVADDDDEDDVKSSTMDEADPVRDKGVGGGDTGMAEWRGAELWRPGSTLTGRNAAVAVAEAAHDFSGSKIPNWSIIASKIPLVLSARDPGSVATNGEQSRRSASTNGSSQKLFSPKLTPMFKWTTGTVPSRKDVRSPRADAPANRHTSANTFWLIVWNMALKAPSMNAQWRRNACIRNVSLSLVLVFVSALAKPPSSIERGAVSVESLWPVRRTQMQASTACCC